MGLADPSEWASTLGVSEATAALILGAIVVGSIALYFARVRRTLAGPGALLGMGFAAAMGVWPVGVIIVMGCAGAALLIFRGARTWG